MIKALFIAGLVFMSVKVMSRGPSSLISRSGVAFIKRYENLSLVKYKDAAGRPTIGWGHLIKANENFPKRISRKEADRLLEEDLAVASSAVIKAVTVPLSIDQADALVSLAYNIGQGAFGRSTLVRIINTGNYSDVPQQFLRWNKIDGVPSKGLSNRRIEESIMFQRGSFK